jgi:hypothetical protein
MKCFYVLVHGRLRWLTDPPSSDKLPSIKPAGFYCHRYVLSTDETSAAEKAFYRVKENLKDLVGEGEATVELEAEEVAVAPMHKLLKPDNRGHSFYETE